MERFEELPKPQTKQEENEAVEKFELTNSEWLRYRLTGQLPERAGQELKQTFENLTSPTPQSIPYESIVDENPEDKERNIKNITYQLNKTPDKEYPEYVVEPTPKERLLIDEAIEHANTLCAMHGGTGRISPDRVFILKKGAVNKVRSYFHTAYYSSISNYIAVDRNVDPILLAKSVFHEALHACGYKSGHTLDDGTVAPLQTGLSTRDLDVTKVYFQSIEEGVIAELTKRYFNEVLSSRPEYSKVIESTNNIKQWLIHYVTQNIHDAGEQLKIIRTIEDIQFLPYSDIMYQSMMKNEDDDKKLNYFRGFYGRELKIGDLQVERLDERIKFEKLLKEIVEKSNGQLDKESLFNQFVDTHFTGNYMPLARTIESVLGKGGFRKIAEDSARQLS